MRYGRLPHDPAILAALPSVAGRLPTSGDLPSPDWTRNVSPDAWAMYGNGDHSDCTAAAIAHAIVTGVTYCPPGRFMTLPDSLNLYQATSGWVPGQPATDRGAYCVDVLRYCRANGIVCDGTVDELLAYPTVNPLDHAQVRRTLEAVGMLYGGFVLHTANETEQTFVDLTTPIGGGHCMLILAADDTGLTGSTWGGLRGLSWEWWDECCKELYGLLTKRWVQGGRTPAGFQTAAIVAQAEANTR